MARKLHVAHSRGGHGPDGPAAGHLPLAPHSPDFSPGPFRTVETQWEFSLCCAKAVRGARRGLPLSCHRDRSDLFILV